MSSGFISANCFNVYAKINNDTAKPIIILISLLESLLKRPSFPLFPISSLVSNAIAPTTSPNKTVMAPSALANLSGSIELTSNIENASIPTAAAIFNRVFALRVFCHSSNDSRTPSNAFFTLSIRPLKSGISFFALSAILDKVVGISFDPATNLLMFSKRPVIKPPFKMSIISLKSPALNAPIMEEPIVEITFATFSAIVLKIVHNAFKSARNALNPGAAICSFIDSLSSLIFSIIGDKYSEIFANRLLHTSDCFIPSTNSTNESFTDNRPSTHFLATSIRTDITSVISPIAEANTPLSLIPSLNSSNQFPNCAV